METSSILSVKEVTFSKTLDVVPTGILQGIEELKSQPKVHVRVVQRGLRKFITSVENLEYYFQKMDLKENKITSVDLLLSYSRKKIGCNGHTNIDKDHKELGKILYMQGDQRTKICKILIDNKIVPKEEIVVHGI
jgi:translation initiation factor 1